MTTFADLMTLLLCFFVLLLSFSEIDRHKFKVLTGSLREAFGVQRLRNVWDLPKGIDIISSEFNEPSFTSDVLKEKIRSAVELTRRKGNLNVNFRENEVSMTVTIDGKLLFGPGEVNLREEALPVLDRFKDAISASARRVVVIGHTDESKINSSRFASNWELSSARACAVVRYLIDQGSLEPLRFSAMGKAHTVPVAPNDTRENRAKNRRVELVFQKVLTPLASSPTRRRRFIDIDDLVKPQDNPSRGNWSW
jgi:chemotaxis protein MotB